jgi:hypothetical protein
MMIEYCIKCGTKHEYSLTKPNFCSSCGTPLSAQTSNLDSLSESRAAEPELAAEEVVPKISELQYSINTSSNKRTFGDLISEAERDPQEKYTKSSVRPKAKYDPTEDVIQSTMKQCRSKRDPEEIGGEEK